MNIACAPRVEPTPEEIDHFKEMVADCVKEMTLEDKINFLKAGEKELHIPYSKVFNGFEGEIDIEKLDESVYELDWIWK